MQHGTQQLGFDVALGMLPQTSGFKGFVKARGTDSYKKTQAHLIMNNRAL